MIYYTLLIPTGYLALSSFVFFVAIHLSLTSRFLLFPVLLSSAALSLHTSYYWWLFPGSVGLWNLFVYIWIQHAVSILLIEQVVVSQSEYSNSWIAAYKLYNNPRRLPPSLIHKRYFPITRLTFATQRLVVPVLCWLTDRYVITPMIILPLEFAADDFNRYRQSLFRRCVWTGTVPVIDSREIKIRIFISLYWIWVNYLNLSLAHALLAILFVLILQIDIPEEWPPIFGSSLDAYSIRRFWSKFWHQLATPARSSGRLISRRMIGLVPGSRHEKVFIAFWLFLTSAFIHAAADFHAGEVTLLVVEIRFFLVNFVAGGFELLVERSIRRLRESTTRNTLSKEKSPPLMAKMVGYVWVLGFFFWVVPKWQYPKLDAILSHY